MDTITITKEEYLDLLAVKLLYLHELAETDTEWSYHTKIKEIEEKIEKLNSSK